MSPSPPTEAQAAILAAVAGYHLARVPVAAVATDDDALDAVAELVADGWLEDWELDGEAGVILSARSAAMLRLQLDQDSRRWVPARRPIRPRKCDPRSELMFEVDLDDEMETPLSEYTEERAGERIRRRRPGDLEGRIDPGRLFSPATHLPTPTLFLTGVFPFPQPGQDRGPLAPRAVPDEADVRRAERPGAVSLLRPPMTCYTCRGNALGLDVACHCGKWGRDIHLRYDDRPKPPTRRKAGKGKPGKEPRGKRYVRQPGDLKGGIGA